MKNNILVLGLAVIVVVGLFFFLAATNSSETTTVKTVGETYEVLVSDNPLEHQKGLSNTDIGTLGADGMLFVFSDKKERTFWMKDMNYALDVIWLRDGKVMKIQTEVPPPEGDEEPVYMYSRPFEVDMVLELPAGQVVRSGIVEGHILDIPQFIQ